MAQETTPPQVAATATLTTDDLGGRLTLLGTFGSHTNRQALLKLRGGKTATVSHGDRVNGQTVVAIEEGRTFIGSEIDPHWVEYANGQIAGATAGAPAPAKRRTLPAEAPAGAAKQLSLF